MAESWWLFLAVVTCFAGMSWLALAKESHWRQVCGQERHPKGRLRVLGALALMLSLGWCFQADHPSIAILVWVMLLAASALAIALLLSWRASWLRIMTISRARKRVG